MEQLIEPRIKRVMVDGIPVLVLFVGIGLCVTASSHATVPAPATPSVLDPWPSVVVHDKPGDAAAGDVDIRSVRVLRSHPYCPRSCPEGADGALAAVFTLAKPVRNNAIYSLFLTSGGSVFSLRRSEREASTPFSCSDSAMPRRRKSSFRAAFAAMSSASTRTCIPSDSVTSHSVSPLRPSPSMVVAV